MTKDEALAFLNKDGNLSVPCSRYGRNTSECAPIAYALAEIVADAVGGEITEADLDYATYLVVNDLDDAENLITEHGTVEHRKLLDR